MCCIKHLLLIRQPAWAVYAALSTVDGLAQWWTPQVSGDPNEGGSLRFFFGNHHREMLVRKNEPYGQVVWRCTDGPSEWIDTEVTFEIGRQSDETSVLLFSHDKWAVYSRMFYQCSYDWAMFLRSLKRYLETGRGNPYPHQQAWDASETLAE